MTSAQKTDPFGTIPTPFHSSHFPTELSPDENSKECRNLLKSLVCICRCGGQTGCEVPVDSTIFGDPCPGTFKYVEVHYACRKGERATQREENSSTAPLNFSLFPIKSRRARPPKAKLFCSPQCNGSYLLRGRGPLKRHLFLHRHREWASRRRQSCSLT